MPELGNYHPFPQPMDNTSEIVRAHHVELEDGGADQQAILQSWLSSSTSHPQAGPAPSTSRPSGSTSNVHVYGGRNQSQGTPQTSSQGKKKKNRSKNKNKDQDQDQDQDQGQSQDQAQMPKSGPGGANSDRQDMDFEDNVEFISLDFAFEDSGGGNKGAKGKGDEKWKGKGKLDARTEQDNYADPDGDTTVDVKGEMGKGKTKTMDEDVSYFKPYATKVFAAEVKENGGITTRKDKGRSKQYPEKNSPDKKMRPPSKSSAGPDMGRTRGGAVRDRVNQTAKTKPATPSVLARAKRMIQGVLGKEGDESNNGHPSTSDFKENQDFISLTFNDEEEDTSRRGSTAAYGNGQGERSHGFGGTSATLTASSSAAQYGGKKRKMDETDVRDDRTRSKGKGRASDMDDPQTPWMRDVDWRGCRGPGEMLNREVKVLFEYLQPTPSEHNLRAAVIELLRRAITQRWPDAGVWAFGSFETRLYLPNGDIDLVLVTDSIRHTQSAKVEALYTIKNIIQRTRLASGNIQVISKAKVPIIKFVTPPSLGSFNVDVSINQTNGVNGARLVNDLLDSVGRRTAEALILVVKWFLGKRGLNEVFTGGLGSYSIVCLVVSFLQIHPRIQTGQIQPFKNLGILLTEFFHLYGSTFNSDETGISVASRCYFSKVKRGWHNPRMPWALSIEDPGDASNDVSGGSSNFLSVRRAFAGAYEILTTACLVQQSQQLNGQPPASSQHSDSSRPSQQSSQQSSQGSLLRALVSVTPKLVSLRAQNESLWRSGDIQRTLGLADGDGKVPMDLSGVLPGVGVDSEGNALGGVGKKTYFVEDESGVLVVDDNGLEAAQEGGVEAKEADLHGYVETRLDDDSEMDLSGSEEGEDVQDERIQEQARRTLGLPQGPLSDAEVRRSSRTVRAREKKKKREQTTRIPHSGEGRAGEVRASVLGVSNPGQMGGQESQAASLPQDAAFTFTTLAHRFKSSIPTGPPSSRFQTSSGSQNAPAPNGPAERFTRGEAFMSLGEADEIDAIYSSRSRNGTGGAIDSSKSSNRVAKAISEIEEEGSKYAIQPNKRRRVGEDILDGSINYVVDSDSEAVESIAGEHDDLDLDLDINGLEGEDSSRPSKSKVTAKVNGKADSDITVIDDADSLDAPKGNPGSVHSRPYPGPKNAKDRKTTAGPKAAEEKRAYWMAKAGAGGGTPEGEDLYAVGSVVGSEQTPVNVEDEE